MILVAEFMLLDLREIWQAQPCMPGPARLTTSTEIRLAPSQCYVKRDRHTGVSEGFGFVTYGDQDAADAAIAMCVPLAQLIDYS
jgi:RNA recognition motif-containing protein